MTPFYKQYFLLSDVFYRLRQHSLGSFPEGDPVSSYLILGPFRWGPLAGVFLLLPFSSMPTENSRVYTPGDLQHSQWNTSIVVIQNTAKKKARGTDVRFHSVNYGFFFNLSLKMRFG